MENKIIQALSMVDPQLGIREFRMGVNKENWIILFDYYNSKNEKRIGPGCLPCFPKVYFFVKQEIAKQTQES